MRSHISLFFCFGQIAAFVLCISVDYGKTGRSDTSPAEYLIQPPGSIPDDRGFQSLVIGYTGINPAISLSNFTAFNILKNMSKLRKPFYHGSKSPHTVLGKWIISLLPWEYDSTYIEPFAGMLGILIGRQPVKNEIVNDLDNNLYNWWTCIRDEPKELSRLISVTPRSRKGLEDAYKIVDNPPPDCSPVRRALALHIVLEQGIYRRMSGKPAWNIRVNPVAARPELTWTGKEIYPLADRFKDVWIENRDALDMLERVCEEPKAVVYCDPPYPTANTTPYRERHVDLERMSDILRQVKARVAISGYGDEWDALGWEKNEKNIYTALIHGRDIRRTERVEVLWTNYSPLKRQTTLDL